MVHERVDERPRGRRPARLLPFEVRRFFHCRACDPYARGQNGADEKGDTPSPRVQARGAQRIDGQQRDADGEESPDLAERGGHRRDQAAPRARRAFKQIRNDGDVLASDRKSHETAEEKKKPAGRGACLSVGREQGGPEHRHGHERHGHEHRSASAEPIPDVAKDGAAERAQQIGDGECGQSRADRGFAGAKKYPRKHCGEVKVEGEVVPFQNSRERRHCDGGAGHALPRAARVVHSGLQAVAVRARGEIASNDDGGVNSRAQRHPCAGLSRR